MLITSSELEDLPNRRNSLRLVLAKCCIIHRQATALVSIRIAHKPYRCPECRAEIFIGSEHTLVFIPSMPLRFNHHHLHLQCFQKLALEYGTNIEKISTSNTEPKKLNSKGRKARNKARRANRANK